MIKFPKERDINVAVRISGRLWRLKLRDEHWYWKAKGQAYRHVCSALFDARSILRYAQERMPQ